jgi:hypothetical protein
MKVCKFNSNKRCWHSSCSWLDFQGNVVCCGLLPNPAGRFRRRVVAPVHGSLFSKHLRGGR